MNLLEAILLYLAGAAAGFVNVNAGGGSFITIPLLVILGGLPVTAANGSNRLAILLQNLMAARNFRNHGFRDLRQGVKLGTFAGAGALIGSSLALEISERIFSLIFSVMMVLMLLIILRPSRESSCHHSQETLRRPVLQMAVFFFIGIYGGFIQAGTGYLVIFSLCMLGGLSLVKTNSLKIVIIATYLIPSLTIFIIHGQVRWIPALVLAAGTSTGGWFGTTFAVKKGDRWIKLVLAVAMVAMAAKMAGLF